MNRVILMGRLTRDPDIRYSQSAEDSMAIARFTLAIDRRGSRNNQNSEQQTADFIHCVAFKGIAEVIEKYVHQGTKVAIQGRIHTGSYTNKEGQKIYTTDVIVDDFEFSESKSNSSGNSGEGAGVSPADDGFMSIPDDCVDDAGLPFN